MSSRRSSLLPPGSRVLGRQLFQMEVVFGANHLFTMASEDGARTRRTAGAKCVVAQYARTDIRKHSFAVRAVESWNRLPNSIRAESKPERFKQRLKLEKP